MADFNTVKKNILEKTKSQKKSLFTTPLKAAARYFVNKDLDKKAEKKITNLVMQIDDYAINNEDNIMKSKIKSMTSRHLKEIRDEKLDKKKKKTIL